MPEFQSEQQLRTLLRHCSSKHLSQKSSMNADDFIIFYNFSNRYTVSFVIIFVNNQLYFLFTEPPSQPTGPLTHADVTRSSVTLKWRPPESDGGLDLKSYVIERREVARLKWQKVATIRLVKPLKCDVLFHVKKPNVVFT